MIDQVIVLAYLIIVLIIGLMYGRNTVSIEDYAVGKRNFSNWVLIAGIAATMIAASGTSGLTGKIHTFGLISSLSYFGVVISRMLIAFVIAPRMKPFLGLISSGDIFEKLYGKEAKLLIGILTLVEGPLLAAAQILATYQAGQIFFGFSKELAAIITTIVIIAYCFRGGIRSVTATDVFQFIIMIIAIPIVAAMAIERIGGFESFIYNLNQKNMLWGSVVRGDTFKHFIIFLSLSITCVFPLTIQRMLMAKNIKQIKITFFANGIITVLFYIAIGIIGLASALILPDIDPNFAFPALIDEILPPGIRGLVIAGLIAIFMSSSDSDMNISSIALTQDLLRPIFKQRLTEKMIFIITRMSFVFIGFFAVIIALYYSNALDILFLVMVLANSVYFPGMFFGILGLSPSKRSFWLGVSAGAIIATVMCIGFKIFPLYAMIAAILANSFILIISCTKQLYNKAISIKNLIMDKLLSSKEDTFFEFKKASYLVLTSSYSDVFATIVLLNSVIPFFIKSIYLQPLPFVFCQIASGVLAVLILLRQAFSDYLNKGFPIIWHLTILLSLTFNIAILITQNQFSLILFFDSIVVFSLLFLLLRKTEVILHIISFIVLAILLKFFGKYNEYIDYSEFQNWSVFLHSIALILCLFLFRKREVAAYRFMTKKFAHEACRTISAFNSSASVLGLYLPVLVEKYRINNNSEFSEQELEKILSVPKNLSITGTRTWESLNQMIAWMEEGNIKGKKFYTSSIGNSLKSALDDSSLHEEFKKRISIKKTNDFIFSGDGIQIGQVILNILENAWHAVKDVPGAYVSIWTENTDLFIKDTGVGINKQDIPNIFEDFFSTKGTSGQGLAFCKLVMEQNQGSIICESKPREFTQFKLSFPLAFKDKGTIC